MFKTEIFLQNLAEVSLRKTMIIVSMCVCVYRCLTSVLCGPRLSLKKFYFIGRFLFSKHVSSNNWPSKRLLFRKLPYIGYYISRMVGR